MYEQLFTYVAFVSLLFWISATASVFVLRRKRPELPRPYKTWGYPDAAGVKQLSRILGDMDYEVRLAAVPRACLHLGGAISALGSGRILCCGGELPEAFLRGFDTITVPRRGPSTGNVICLGNGEVIANSAENAEAIELLERRGVTVHRLDLSEFRKGEGEPSCLVLPLERG